MVNACDSVSASSALALVLLLGACSGERADPAPAARPPPAPAEEAASPAPGGEAEPPSAEPLGEATAAAPVAYEEGECRLVLGPDRRFPARAGPGYGFGVSHLPALTADGARIAIDLSEPTMDEGPAPEPEPVDLEIYAADGRFLETRVLAPAEAWDADEDAWAPHRAASNAFLREAGFQSFRRLRGPVRDVRPEGVVEKLDALEGPCRRAWGLPADARFTMRYLGGEPAEDDRCTNEVHDVDLHVDLAHRVGLLVQRVGTYADLCASGDSYRLFRWVAPDEG